MRDLSELPSERLEDEISSLAAHIHAATCRWLGLVAEFDRRRGWAPWGCHSAAHWLSYRCGIAPETAREQVRVARRLDELPRVREAFARGELSYSKVRAITRIANTDNMEALVELAVNASAAQLERVVRGYRQAASADLDIANAAHAQRFLRWEWEDDGSLRIRGRLAPDDGAAFIAAIQRMAADVKAEDAGAIASDPQPVDDEVPYETLIQHGCGGAPDPGLSESAEQPRFAGRGARAADALVRLIEGALAADVMPGPRAGIGEIVLHVDADALTHADPDADTGERCHLQDGPSIPSETARRLACDASLTVVRERHGRPLDLGRRTRTITPALRRALQVRDGGCRFPGCDRHTGTDAHHIEHWVHGGRTDRENLILLCRYHHRLLHEGGYHLQRTRDGLVFRRPDGTPLELIQRTAAAHGDAIEADHHQLDITPDTPTAQDGGRLDLPGPSPASSTPKTSIAANASEQPPDKAGDPPPTDRQSGGHGGAAALHPISPRPYRSSSASRELLSANGLSSTHSRHAAKRW